MINQRYKEFWSKQDYERVKHLSLKDQEFLRHFSIEVMLRLYLPGRSDDFYDFAHKMYDDLCTKQAQEYLDSREIILTYKA